MSNVLRMFDGSTSPEEAVAAPANEPAPLQFGGGGGNSTGMDIMDAKIAAAEARTDTKFAELRGDLAALRGELRTIGSSTSGIKMTVITTGIATAIAVIGLVIAVFAYGSQMFGTGMDAQTVADRAALSVEQRSTERFDTMDARYDRIEQQMTQVLEAVRANDAP